MTEDSSPATAPVYRSRREMRAAGGYAAPVLPELVEPAAAPSLADENIDGIASLFPLLGEVVAEAVTASPVVETAPQAAETVSVVESVAPPLVLPAPEPAPVEAAAPVVITTSSISIIPAPADVPAVPAPSTEASDATQAMDVSEIFGFITDTPIPQPPTPSAAASPAMTVSPAHAPASPAPGFPSRRSVRPEAEDIRPKKAPKRRAKRDRPSAVVRPNSAGALDRKTLGQRITGLGVMVLIGGLFTVLALPAYADNHGAALAASAKLGSAQKMTVSAAAADETTATLGRDSYTATSATALKTLYASAIRQQNLTAYLQSGAKAQGDDYPWYAELSRNQGGGLSPLNYYYRECVDFVAWRLNRDAGSTAAPFKWTWSTLTPNGGNASQWKSAWLAHGWATGTTPQVGSVAWFTDNHVAYVSGILNDGSVLLEEYNWQGQHLYSTRIIQPGDAYYLYAPPA